MSHQFLLPPTSTQNKTLHHVPKGPKSRVARPSSVILLLFFWLADDASRSKPSVFDMTTTAGVVPSLPAVFFLYANIMQISRPPGHCYGLVRTTLS